MMAANAKQLVWEGKTSRTITIAEAQTIAEKVYTIPNILDEMNAIRAEIERVTCISELPR